MRSSTPVRRLFPPRLPSVHSRQTCRSYSSAPGPAMRQRCPQKIIHDYLTPMPSHQLSTLLTDLLPATSSTASSATIQDPALDLPQGAHLVYFPPQQAASELAPDGADADHVPPGFSLAPREDWESSGGRRLWVGGELNFKEGWRDRLRLDGSPWACKEEIGEVNEDGKKTYVDVWRRYGRAGQEWDIEERRTLGFVEQSGSPNGKLIKLPFPPTTSYTFTPSPTHLFHFSALTYNAHFIHLDPSSALVHGPLLLALMLRMLSAHGASVRRFEYRNLAPLHVGRQARACLRRGDGKWDLWVEGPQGGLAVRGKATLE